ncbi:hypothetical protein LTR56_006412 [Elasticomyces elasticus]|nr:hypothetical protein LTR56_006412 [Elasticomyces elasticus]KAK3662033.1 hypothetical protein LTR22_007204 [Elasticomyces elasticus]KAK4933200.1 hypothetical protein LTR49_000684 [Elasticomyces elasticus]KAK5756830.1 hypothetical protein LTS12_013031 [Elasticomyces elasticus]
MAGKKRPKSAPSQTAKASESPTASRASPPARKRRRSTKGYTETKEIDSDEENKPKLPSRGMLAGLDPNATDLSQRRPRGEQKPNYNMKFHPSLDPYIKLATAARYNAGLPTQSSPVKFITDGETSVESEPTLAGDSDSETDDDSDLPIVISRAPDLKASRHSTRTEAQKPVNYSRKYHPNDLDLPGFKAKAKAAIKAGEFVAPKRPQKRKSDGDGTSKGVPADKATGEGSTSGNEEEEEGRGSDDDQGAKGYQEGVHEDEGDVDSGDDERPQTARKAEGPPRKKLKSTSSGSPSAVKARKKPQPRKKQSKKAVELGSEAEMNSTEFGDYMEKAGQGSQSRPIDIPNDHVDEQESEEEDNGLDNAVIPSRQVDPAATLARSARSSSERQTSREPTTKSPTARIDSETESDGVAAAPTPKPSSGHYVPQSDGYQAAPSPPTHLRPSDLHVRTPENAPLRSDGIEDSDASAAAATKNGILVSSKSRATAASRTHARVESINKGLSHEGDLSEVIDVDHGQHPSFFADAVANSHELDNPVDDLSAEDKVASSVSGSDSTSSVSSGIVPRPTHGEEEEDSNDDEEEDGHEGKHRSVVQPPATKMTSTQQALTGKARGALDMMPATQSGKQSSSHTLSGDTMKSRVKASSTLRAGSSATASASTGLSVAYDGAGDELETLWRASQKPGGSYRGA